MKRFPGQLTPTRLSHRLRYDTGVKVGLAAVVSEVRPCKAFRKDYPTQLRIVDFQNGVPGDVKSEQSSRDALWRRMIHPILVFWRFAAAGFAKHEARLWVKPVSPIVEKGFVWVKVPPSAKASAGRDE